MGECVVCGGEVKTDNQPQQEGWGDICSVCQDKLDEKGGAILLEKSTGPLFVTFQTLVETFGQAVAEEFRGGVVLI